MFFQTSLLAYSVSMSNVNAAGQLFLWFQYLLKGLCKFQLPNGAGAGEPL